MRLLFISIKDAIIANALIFLLAFLHMSETWYPSLLSTLDFSRFRESQGNQRDAFPQI